MKQPRKGKKKVLVQTFVSTIISLIVAYFLRTACRLSFVLVAMQSYYRIAEASEAKSVAPLECQGFQKNSTSVFILYVWVHILSFCDL